MRNSHHNTTNEAGETLADFEGRARTQEERVLVFFRKNPRPDGWTPSQVNVAAMPECPITSTRRALTNLTRDGHLTKLAEKRMGQYGRPEHAWALPERDPHQPTLI